ncbi:MAG: glycosyltransferase family 39 protein [Planctomycetes bacterium]|nr:glycosyltransferase family 39 protein [Planctomycetota bacterium]
MRLRDLTRRLVARPAWGVAALAVVVRGSIVAHMWSSDPLVRTPTLDGEYYLNWARDIASGDLVGARGVIGGEPWFLNPLYAYVLAPVIRLVGGSTLPILFGQACLGALTAALTAATAARLFGDVGLPSRRAGWVAGLLVAFSAPLAQLDAHVASTELAAFMVAGTCFACAAPTSGDRRGAHGPLAAGLWLGIGALARPITPLALPFIAWRFARESSRRWVTAATVAVVFGLCAVPSLVRNWSVSGEPAIYTVASGLNAHLGNNPEAKHYRSMTSRHFRFNPIVMHEDGRNYVEQVLGRRPTRGEVSSWFWRLTFDETFFRDPSGSFAFYANKARWFFCATEVPSSASYASDLRLAPGLGVAFVPTWLVASLALAGAFAWRRRTDVLLGPGAVAFAHLAVLVLVFPLSHYRAPVIPALAVLGAGAVVAAWAAWESGRRAGAGVVVGVAAGAAIIGWIPPGPDPLAFRDEAILAMNARDTGDLVAAEKHAWIARDVYRLQWPGEPDMGLAWEMIAEMQFRQGKWKESIASFTQSLALDPTPPLVRLWRSHAYERVDDFRASEKDARDVVERYPFMVEGWTRLAEILSAFPDRGAEARQALDEAIKRGYRPDATLLRRLGLAPR